MNDYPWKTSKLLDREVPKDINKVPQVWTSVVLGIKYEPQIWWYQPKWVYRIIRSCLQKWRKAWKLLYMVAYQWTKVACGMCSLTKVHCSLSPKSNSPPQTLGTPCQEVSNDRLSRENARPKDSNCLDFYVPDGKSSRLSQLNPKCSGRMSWVGYLSFFSKFVT